MNDLTKIDFFDVLEPPAYNICGVVLRPLSLGHYLILNKLNNPFISEQVKTDINLFEGTAYLYIFLIVCGQTFEQNNKMLSDVKVLKNTIKDFEYNIIKQMYKQCWRNRILFPILYPIISSDRYTLIIQNYPYIKRIADRILLPNKSWNIQLEMNKVSEYISTFIKMPIFEQKQNEATEPSGISWINNLFSLLRNEYGYSETEILNFPITRVFAEWTAFAEKNGMVHVLNDVELEMVRVARIQRDQKIEEKH